MQLRFNQVAIGQSFHWRGEHFIKVNSLIASNTTSGKQQLVPRSELVQLEGTATPAAPAATPAPAREKILPALEAYHAVALRCLDAVSMDANSLGTMRDQLNAARAQILADLEE